MFVITENIMKHPVYLVLSTDHIASRYVDLNIYTLSSSYNMASVKMI